MEKFFLLSMVAIILLVSAACGNSDSDETKVKTETEIRTLTIGTYNSTESPDGKAAEFFKKYIEENSNGQLEVEIYHNSVLGDSNDQIEGTMMGSQDMFMVSSELLAPWAPRANLVSSLYLFRDDNHLLSFLNSDLFDPVHEQLAENNIMLLNEEWNWVQGPFRVLVSKKPVKDIEDLQSVKMRVFENTVYRQAWESFGTNPITVSYPEIYMGLQQGLIDALEVPMNVVRDNNYTEVAKYITRMNSYPQRYQIIMNTDTFNELSEDLQKVVREATYKAGEEFSKIVQEKLDEDIDYLQQEHGVEYYDEIDLAPFEKTMEELYKKLEKQGEIEEGIIEKIKDL